MSMGQNTPNTMQYGVTSVMLPLCNEIFQISERDETNTLSSTKYVRHKGRRPLGITNIQLVFDKQKNGPQNFAGRLKGGGVKTY
jgi:hypothetical protein